MGYILGIDTGGTYTDAVIYEEETAQILSKGKALTTRQNLVIGIENSLKTLDPALFACLRQVNLSTTLATNAIVEGRGNKIALFLLGDQPKGELPVEYVVPIEGKYDIRGRQVETLNTEQVKEALVAVQDKVGAIAISGFASIRNNTHELQVKKIIREHCQLPIVCAHEMSSMLGYFDRTITTALNARLLSVIYELLTAVKQVLAEQGLDLPLMIVTGSGSLVSEKVAMERPIETVLSGPAASIAGAMYLAKRENGLVLDMGGTTTDIALIRDGKVKLNARGADVGGYRIQIEAADIYTFGMGGDSRIFVGRENKLVVGPNKVMPVCRAIATYPQLFEEMKEIEPRVLRQKDRRNLYDGFQLYLMENATDLNPVQKRIVNYLKDGPHTVLQIREQMGTDYLPKDMEELEVKGVVMRIAFTPTDLLHVEGTVSLWHIESSLFFAEKLAMLYGMTLENFTKHCRKVIEEKLAYCCRKSKNVPQMDIIGVGAPSHCWLPGMAQILQQELHLPEHREVANAIGAAVAEISESGKAVIRYNSILGVYTIFLPNQRLETVSLEQAKALAKKHLIDYVNQKAIHSGCEKAKTIVVEDLTESESEFVECEILVTAEGKPKWLCEGKDKE